MLPVDKTTEIATHAYDDVIDVRSPSEFDEDHIPGAINLPVLSDEERSEVGTLYRQSRFDGRRRGAALISANIARHLNTYFADRARSYRPLIYCWRGGQRSQSLAHILRQIGWNPAVLEGGYRTFRRRVIDELEAIPGQLRFRTLAGLTGTAKTDILSRMEMKGAQVLDLEGVACHRGSLLGADPKHPQPSQKLFESRLWHLLTRFDASRDVWLESESNRIGNRQCPKALWHSIKQTGRYEVRAPLASRVRYLLAEYDHFQSDPEALKNRLAPLKVRYGGKKIESWNR